MATAAKRLGIAALTLTAVWAWTASPAPAQAPQPGGARPAPAVNPAAPAGQPVGANPQPGGMTGFTAGLGGAGFGLGSPLPGTMSSPYGMGRFTSVGSSPGAPGSSVANPYVGLPISPYNATPYDNPYYSYADPYGGGLRGAADAINAEGQYQVMFQQARLLNQEAERSKQDTRRKIFDEWLYERANTPTLQDLRERSLRYELRRALTSPDQPDIVSGYALNTILKDLEKKPNLAAGAPLADIDPALLKQLNLKPEATAGNVGVLKPVVDGGSLNWPLVLQGAEFQDEVRRLNEQSAEAVKLVQNTGTADAAVLNNMLDEIRRLRAKVMSRVHDLTETQQVEANRFLGRLDDAVRALEQPNAQNYFNNKFAAKGKTAADLVKYMANNGLVFGPAASGDEAAYAALHNAFVGLANALRDQGDTASSAGGK